MVLNNVSLDILYVGCMKDPLNSTSLVNLTFVELTVEDSPLRATHEPGHPDIHLYPVFYLSRSTKPRGKALHAAHPA